MANHPCLPPKSLRFNLGATVLSTTSEQLRSLLSSLGSTAHKRDLAKIGVALAAISGRSRPWGYKYVHSVLNENLAAGKDFSAAVDSWLATFDGRLAHGLAGFKKIEVYGRSDQAGAQVDGRVEFCGNPECGIKFLTDHPTRRFCKICHPPIRK